MWVNILIKITWENRMRLKQYRMKLKRNKKGTKSLEMNSKMYSNKLMKRK